ncbi:MAG TPA: ABC transporter ATP-binding protein [Syntrophorhabdaceae bacterium]|nr:ABC transporter ATP-binding protein [Syntrophorhabdaceae bacterium]
MAEKQHLLTVQDLRTYFYTRVGVVKAVDGVSFHLDAGEALGMVGESGCGKSVTCHSIVRLLPPAGSHIVGGKILFEGDDLVQKKEREMKRWRGKQIGMILQDPLVSLNPVHTIERQVGEAIRLDNRRQNKGFIRQKVIAMLERVMIPSAKLRLSQYPFQFSGGMRQRVLAAISLARQPKLIIADEPTTALDVTIQDQFLRLLKELQRQYGLALLLVTHDLGLVAETCDRVAVMYAGRIVETGSVEKVFDDPAHPYTRALMMALPELETKKKRLYQIQGEPPSLLNPPSGCSFSPRCSEVMEICRKEYPPSMPTEAGGVAACWLWANRSD